LGDIVTFNPPGGTPTFVGRGSKIEHPDVLPIFWGPYWPGSGSLTTSAIMQAIRSVASGPYLDGLKQYGYEGPTSVRGEMIDSSTPGINPTSSAKNYGDVVYDFISNLLDNDSIDNVDDNHDLVVAVFLDPSIPPPPGATGANSSIEKFEFLDDNTRFEWAWIATGGRDVQAVSQTFSHELVEAITDPFNTGLHQTAPASASDQGQIGDVCNQPATIGGAGVVAYWSTADNACIIPTPGTRRVYLTIDVTAIESHDGPAERVYVDLGRPLCDAGYFDYVERTYRNNIIVKADLRGYESPIVGWTINGQTVSLYEDNIEVNATWQEPPYSNLWVPRFRKPTATLGARHSSPSATELDITVGPNEGNVALSIGCFVSESFDVSTGTGSTTRTATLQILVTNQEIAWGQAYKDAKKACEHNKNRYVGPAGGVRPPQPGDPPDLAQILVKLLTENGPNRTASIEQAAQLVRNFNNELADALMSHVNRSQ